MSNEFSSAPELKTYCAGTGFFVVFAAREATWTRSATKKLVTTDDYMHTF